MVDLGWWIASLLVLTTCVGEWRAWRVYLEKERLRAENTSYVEMLDAAIGDYAAAKAEVEKLTKAGDHLSFMAQTSGGTAGRDAGLVAAIDGWAEARAALTLAQGGAA